METNSLVVTDSNVQALANALCMFAEKMGELSRQYPEYPNSLMGALQQLEDKMQALTLRMQSTSEFLAPALERFAQEPAEIWKNENVDALLVQVAAAMQSFSDILQTQHEADDLVPVSTATEILEDVQPIFTDDVISTVEQKIESAKKPGDKISWHDVLEILSFVLCLITLIRDGAQDVLPDKHEEFVENALSSIIEKMDNGIPSEVEINKYTEGTCDSLDTSDDLLDLPENTPKCESLNETADTQN